MWRLTVYLLHAQLDRPRPLALTQSHSIYTTPQNSLRCQAMAGREVLTASCLYSAEGRLQGRLCLPENMIISNHDICSLSALRVTMHTCKTRACTAQLLVLCNTVMLYVNIYHMRRLCTQSYCTLQTSVICCLAVTWRT